ncbi:recombinase family protein [Carboxydochorda subterranea]|uniref:Recombinase family protein n=1 Tax=Carboxydichorda subterranea TaxID=3109565 RepID=A0ABZ1BU79_9FIRM|nr:recombinase family protein [Limnochorda sp. L945t]WRP16324.1 recombinase family protein [Limnochorda sp. L945t]
MGICPPAVLRRIFAWRLEGRSYQWIRDRLNAEGVPAPRGTRWRNSTLHTLLGEDYILTYAGYGVWNKHYRKGPRPRGVRYKPREEWIVEPRAHPAIIDEETADRLIALARQTREHYETGRGRKGAGSTYLLTGENLDGEPIFRCAACGGHLIGSANGSGGKRRRKYVCAEARYSGGCETVWVDAERLEAAVLDYLRRHYLTADFARAVAEEVRRRQAAQNDDDPAAELRRRLRETERQLANVRQVIPAGGDPQALAAELNRLVATARTLQQQIAAAEQRRATPTISEEQVRTWLDEALRIVDGTDVEPLRRLVRVLAPGHPPSVPPAGAGGVRAGSSGRVAPGGSFVV